MYSPPPPPPPPFETCCKCTDVNKQQLVCFCNKIHYFKNLTIFRCVNSDWSAVVPKFHCLGPHTYGVLSVWFKRSQLSTGSVPNNIMKTFSFTMWSVADLIASNDTIYIMRWLPRYSDGCGFDTVSLQSDWRRN